MIGVILFHLCQISPTVDVRVLDEFCQFLIHNYLKIYWDKWLTCFDILTGPLRVTNSKFLNSFLNCYNWKVNTSELVPNPWKHNIFLVSIFIFKNYKYKGNERESRTLKLLISERWRFLKRLWLRRREFLGRRFVWQGL